ncbi:LOW QUALITY PROTEIN: vascular endothelial growth factor D-like [Oncorhynchus tshawytscha]|uniref:Platelet-derived growth factor (PDGF) family profile domain-containing protein n=1 Tax=Oncorhynchus tshawytscha TaxID=74940 RepID=A0AAZ3Q659_ONCTS|nr:vascular endothelial growth factor D-like [Oncorhynchus tshawytscha]XP_042171750.1 LOW QUALITY PROTEIN: vascular endothelial growth factor D-like [Oncorhynchus tshawytscha]
MQRMLAAGVGMMLVLVRLNLGMPNKVQDDPSSLRVINQEKWERDVRSASSLDELLMLTDFPDWKLWKCGLKLKHLETSPSSSSSQQPNHRSSSSSSSTGSGSHRSTRYAVASYSLEILKAIDDEWQKTQCTPRETCVDVAKELGTTTSMFFKPPCVSVFRCNGCCNKEGVSCRNTSTAYVNKTLLSVIPFKYGPEPVLIKVANHTECKCMEPPLIRRQAHIRSHRRNGCSPMRQFSKSEDSRRLCASGLIWDCMADRCVSYPSTEQPDFSPNMRTVDCDIDVDRCDCVPDRTTLSPQPTLTQDPDHPTLHVT